jgi:preprotein translocase subunit SecD
MGQQIMAALQAHIAEHLGFQYRKQIEERLGVPLPPPDEEMPEDIEVQLARLVADAGKQLTQSHQQQAAQQQAQQQAADPLFQLEQQKVQVKQTEVQAKAQKMQADTQLAQQKAMTQAQLDAARLKLEQERMKIDLMKEGARVKSQEGQNAQRLKFDALKVLATPKQQPKTEKPKGTKE